MNRKHPRPKYVIDTNVFIELHTCADLKRDFDELYEIHREAAVDHEKVRYRIRRAREVLLLGMYLHKIHATTISLGGEAVEKLQLVAPPNVAAGSLMETDFVTTFVWLTKGRLLGGWLPKLTKTRRHAEGNAADAELVRQGKIRGIPVVSHEGYRQDGTINEDKLVRRLAREQHVRVLLAREVYEGQFDEDGEIDRFLARFREQAPQYLARRGISDRMGEILIWIHGFYLLVLRGEVAGRDTPLAP